MTGCEDCKCVELKRALEKRKGELNDLLSFRQISKLRWSEGQTEIEVLLKILEEKK